VPSTTGDARPLTLADLAWVLDTGGERRKRLAGFAPRFWRPAPEARDRHQEFLSHQIQDPNVVALRTDHGFVFAARSGEMLVIDDMALDDDHLWPEDGTILLRSVFEHGNLRFVCPVPELARTRTALDLGMTLGEAWWHRDLPAVVSATAVVDPSVRVDGAAGRLVEAPPIYAPGGPVLLVFEVDSGASLAAIEGAAAAEGAVVSVVSRSPGQPVDLLISRGYKHTTDFFTWRR
jgi:hypothetical protein